MAKSKKKKWMKFRHKLIVPLAGPVIGAWCRMKLGITIEKFKGDKKRPYLILYNHQTAFDQFFVGLSFMKPIYYLATEDIFSKGFVSSLLRWAVAPIPIKKQTTDLTAVKNCLRVAREGGNICIAPEGNRTYSGRTEYMSPAIAAMAKKLKLPIALYRIEGGYGVQPRWSDGIRKGKMKGYVAQVIEPEEYANLTPDELFTLIEQGLFVDENKADGVFRSAKRGEYLERAIYYCPFCGLSEFHSQGAEMVCKHCGKTVIYGENKAITGLNCQFPYSFVGQWYDAQEEFMNHLNLVEQANTLFYNQQVELWDVEVRKKKTCLGKNLSMKVYGNRFEIGERVLPFEEITAVAVLGRNKLNIYYGDNVWQLRGGKRWNALKNVHFYHRYKNIIKGEESSAFLGL